MNITWLWMLVVVGGPVLLVGALIWARLQTAKRDSQIDPGTPGDDPAKGMHPRREPTAR